eukprot:GSA25T00020361001.1
MVVQQDYDLPVLKQPRHQGGEPMDYFDPDDVIQCHDLVKVYARYFDLAEDMKGKNIRPTKREHFREQWAQVMPVGSLSYPQKLCVYVVRNYVVSQQPDGSRPTSSPEKLA